MAKARKVRGVSRYIRQITYVHPSQPGAAKAGTTQKISTVLGPRAQGLALQAANTALREHEKSRFHYSLGPKKSLKC